MRAIQLADRSLMIFSTRFTKPIDELICSVVVLGVVKNSRRLSGPNQ
jgi:hypothetical protein